jgi:hypothetical protein
MTTSVSSGKRLAKFVLIGVCVFGSIYIAHKYITKRRDATEKEIQSKLNQLWSIEEDPSLPIDEQITILEEEVSHINPCAPNTPRKQKKLRNRALRIIKDLDRLSTSAPSDSSNHDYKPFAPVCENPDLPPLNSSFHHSENEKHDGENDKSYKGEKQSGSTRYHPPMWSDQLDAANQKYADEEDAEEDEDSIADAIEDEDLDYISLEKPSKSPVPDTLPPNDIPPASEDFDDLDNVDAPVS